MISAPMVSGIFFEAVLLKEARGPFCPIGWNQNVYVAQNTNAGIRIKTSGKARCAL